MLISVSRADRPGEVTNATTVPMKLHSGVAGFDELIEGGFETGDNVVLLSDDTTATEAIVAAFLGVGGPGVRRVVSLGAVASAAPPGAEIVEAWSGSQPARPDVLDRHLMAADLLEVDRVVVDGLDRMVTNWGARGASEFYRSCCPRLFDRGVLALWVGSSSLVPPGVLEEVTRIAQCVFDLRGGRLRVVKAEGRSSRLQGIVASFSIEDGEPTVSREHAVGRLGEGLRRLRSERGLTQARLAELAGVTPAAISQAESGRRGLSLDTLVPLCDSLGIGLDDLLGTGRPRGPFLARHDRQVRSGSTSPMFDDPASGPRARLVELEPGESGEPTQRRGGHELLLVSDGLVLVDLGDTTPVLRSGDGLLTDESPVTGWSNLGEGRARFFFVVAD